MTSVFPCESNDRCDKVESGDEREKLLEEIRNSLIAIIPAAGYSVRVNPDWNIEDPLLDFLAKPCLRDFHSGKTLLEIIIENVEPISSFILVRVGERLRFNNIEDLDRLGRIKYKIQQDIGTIIGSKRNVGIFYNNPDGRDDGTGATIVSREAKQIVRDKADAKYVLIVASDLPSLSKKDIENIAIYHVRSRNDVTVVSVKEEDAFDHGRVVRVPYKVLGKVKREELEKLPNPSIQLDLNAKIDRGELILLKLPSANKINEEWVRYLVLERDDLEILMKSGSLIIYHPLRGCLEGDKMELRLQDLDECRIILDRDEGIAFDPNSGNFLTILEQSQIGVTPEERYAKYEIEVSGIKFSTDYLNAIRERNVLCMMLNRDIFLKTIRDLDSRNYARVLRIQNTVFHVPNTEIFEMKESQVIKLEGLSFDKHSLMDITECVKISSEPEDAFVLERHENDEYYLPEVANKAKERGLKVGIYRLPRGSARGIDTRTDLRYFSQEMNLRLLDSLQMAGIRVEDGCWVEIGDGFDPKDIESGVILSGNIKLKGKILIEKGSKISDSFIINSRGGIIRIGKEAEISRCILENSNVGEGAVVMDIRIVDKDIAAGSRIIGRAPGASEEMNKGIIRADEEILQCLEQVFGVLIHPTARIEVTNETYGFLKSILSLMKDSGGIKPFIAKYGDQLRVRDYASIEPLKSYSGLTFNIGPNCLLRGHVRLHPPLSMGSFSEIFESSIETSELGRSCNIVRSKITSCIIESDRLNPTKVMYNELDGQIIEAGYPVLEFVQIPEKKKVSEWINFFIDEERSDDLLEVIYGQRQIVKERRTAYLLALQEFYKEFGDGEVLIVRCPARVNLMGRHVDHRGCFVNPIAIHKEVLIIAEARTDSTIKAINVDKKYPPSEFLLGGQLPKRKIGIQEWRDWTRKNLKRRKRRTWVDYLKTVIFAQNMYKTKDGRPIRTLKGANLIVFGDIPKGAGLSSSSALVIATWLMLIGINGLIMSKRRLVEWAGMSEWYVGTRGGIGDHAAMVYAKKGMISHIGFYPLTISHFDFPQGYKIVVCNSLVEVGKMTEARDIFNQRIACYEIALMLIRKNYPELAGKIRFFRDLDSQKLGIELADIYRIVKSLPNRITRDEVYRELPEDKPILDSIFGEHNEPRGGYRLRDITMFGLSECARSKIAPEIISRDMELFGKLMDISHDGDRKLQFQDGRPKRFKASVTDEYLDKLIMNSYGDRKLFKQVEPIFQHGFYDCGSERIDKILRIARTIRGVLGGQILGAGLGGCTAILVRDESIEALKKALLRYYYRSRRLMEESVIVCFPVEGAEILPAGVLRERN